MAAPLSAAEVQKKMAANSAAWKTATPQMQTQLHQANLDLAKQTGQSYNAAQGTYSAPVVAKPVTPNATMPAMGRAITSPVVAKPLTTPIVANPATSPIAANPVSGDALAKIIAAANTAASKSPTATQQGSVSTPTTQPIQPTTTAAPISASQTTGNQSGYPGGLTTAQINADAAARMAKQRAGIEGAVTAGKAARKSLFDYNAKNTLHHWIF